ncbi:glutathione S-transferase family protein [Pantoea sp. A4]|uniref:glutathione S-transferase family protein n=1 Tax=Pantoea sp. A4 TaxID=1225184 RepID=UPI00035F448E|nr:glutathione S-transferase family protein [Pantoea sp. A4]
MILYHTPLSGHGHRVCLLLNMLEIAYERRAADAALRADPAFAELNPWRQIPVLVDGDVVIYDSNAILVYLARRYAPGSHWLPDDPLAAAQVQQWLGHAAGEIRYGVASARIIRQFDHPEIYESAVLIAGRFLPQMERHLAAHTWLANGELSIADLACYAYVACAPEGGVSLQAFPAIQRWLRQVEALPGFEGLPPLPLPE